MAGIIEPISITNPSVVSNEPDVFSPVKKCYSCNPRGTLKEHIISSTNDFVFNHDMFRR